MSVHKQSIFATQANSAARCSIILPHHNYSECVEGALTSVLSQTHANLECIVVDDASERHHREALRTIISKLNDPRVSLIELSANGGQINAMFKGLEAATGEFVGFIDPDDLYEPVFLEVLLRALLNPQVIVPFASCEMGRYRVGGGPISRSVTRFRGLAEEANSYPAFQDSFDKSGYHAFFKPWETGWRWASTSGLLFRHDVLKLLVPVDLPTHIKMSGDVYLAYGAHMLGGSLFVDQLLSWRGVHGKNAAHPDLTFSHFQNPLKDSFNRQTEEVKMAAMSSFLANGAKRFLPVSALGEVMTTHFDAKTIYNWMKTSEAVRDLMTRYVSNVTWDE